MKLLDRLKEIDEAKEDVYVMHEKFERKYDYHMHNKDQLSYVEDGVAYVTVANEYLVVPARHFLWIPAHTQHQLKVSHSATQLHSLYFQPCDAPFYNKLGIYPASQLVIQLIKFTERWNNQFVDYSQEHAHTLYSLYQLLPLAEEHQVKLQLPTSENEKAEAFTQFIHSHYNENITLDTMTKQFNMSERSFCRMFKKELHTSFLQYLKTYRIIQAITLLQKTDWTIEQIANEIGYESLPAFSNTFLEYTGLRPTEMRKTIN